MAAEPPVIAVSGACKTYANGVKALAPVDLVVARGEFVSLLGPSGCGKTTLLHLVSGLLAPDAGSLAWWGGDFASTGTDGRRIAVVFQAPTLMPWARVETNVRLPLDLARVARAVAEREVAAALDLVRLRRFARSLPRELSGGMQMRAAIARALVTRPDLLLMDEPFGALDEFTRQRLDDELITLWRSSRLTVLFVTHSIVEAVYLSTRVVVMAAQPGRVLDEVPVDQPYPRGDDFRASAAFATLCRQLSARVAEAGAAAEEGS